MIYFQTSVRYKKQTDNGEKRVREQYLTKALTCTEAEMEMQKYLEPFATDGLEVSAVKQIDFSEFFKSENENAERFYKVSVVFVIVDDMGNERRSKAKMLVFACNFDDAVKTFKKGMTGSMIDYEINAIQEMPIIDMF